MSSFQELGTPERRRFFMEKLGLLKLIQERESETLEFKSSNSRINEIVETVAALANGSGGKVVIGISQNSEILGVRIGKDTIEQLANKIRNNTDPQIYPNISVEEIEKRSLILVQVMESMDKPVTAFGKAFKRVGSSTHSMSKNEYERLVVEKHKEKLRFDSAICEGASLDDIDKRKVRWFLKKARKERNFNVDPDIPLKKALKRLKLLRKEGLATVAILLFGKDPQKFFLQSEIRCARFKGTESVKPFTDMKVFDGNIIDQVDKAISFVLNHIYLAVWLVPGQAAREEKYEYPPEAIREAIVNAICHRDYRSTANIQIRIFDDRIEIWNPGRLPEGWTVEKLKREHESIPRNRLIAEHFFLIKFIEKWGTGTNDMIQECISWELPEPEFEFTGTSLVVTFWKSKLTEEYLNSLGLNERQTKAVMYVKEQGKITNKEYQELTKVSKATATRELSDIVEKKILEQSGVRGKGTYYKLKKGS
jgi:ATP-dependent DNA helicase RecG